MLDVDIAHWRARITQGDAVSPSDADELETHLRDEVADLATAGLAEDEAFLVAVKRLGRVDRLTAEFAREHSDRLWKQLALDRGDEPAERRGSVAGMVAFAAISAVAIQIARVAAGQDGLGAPWFSRNLGFLAFIPLAAYFAWSRSIPLRRGIVLGAVVVALGVVVNVFPFPASTGSDTAALVAYHLPVVMWFVVGVAYLSGDVSTSSRRMDFIRFSGEWFVYYVLIALGGGVLVGLTSLVLAPVAPEAIDDVMLWIVPSGAAAAVVVAAWLVEAKKAVIENMAPVLTAIFTPLFAVMLVVSAVVYGVGWFGQDSARDTLTAFDRPFDRDLLTVFDALLLVVVGLVLYGLSARDPLKRAGLMDGIRLAAVIAAIVLDLVVLGAMVSRIGEFGFTANRVAALGLNLLLIANLVGTAWLSARLIAGRAPPLRLERWQTSYLPLFGVWAALVVLVLPPLFLFT